MILSANAHFSLAALQAAGLPWYVWVVIIAILLLIVVWAMSRRPAEEAAPPMPAEPESLPRPAAQMEAPAPPAPAAEVPMPPPEPAMPAEMPAAAPAMPEAPAVAEAAPDMEMPAEPPPPAMPAEEPPAMPAEEPPAMPAEPEERVMPQDLTRIEGIGPVIANALQVAGIKTFQQLADADAASVREILRKAGVRAGDPGTWAQQAKLAAAGDWAKLKKLQDRLTGGRRA